MIASISLEGISDVTGPEIETAATDPVIVGTAEGIVELGDIEGVVEGETVGAAVMKMSHANNITFPRFNHEYLQLF